MLSSPLDLKSFQLSSLTQMLSTAPRQPAAAEEGGRSSSSTIPQLERQRCCSSACRKVTARNQQETGDISVIPKMNKVTEVCSKEVRTGKDLSSERCCIDPFNAVVQITIEIYPEINYHR